MISRNQATVKRMKFLFPLLYFVTVTVSANDAMTMECLADVPTVSRVADLSDGHGDAHYCSERTPSIEVDATGATIETEVTTCDATGTEDALSIINSCRSVGGKEITVVYTQECNMANIANNRKDIIGPLCIPKSCKGDEYIYWANSQSNGKLALDFGEHGGCTRKILSMNDA